jgi:hypothetical protein
LLRSVPNSKNLKLNRLKINVSKKNVKRKS